MKTFGDMWLEHYNVMDDFKTEYQTYVEGKWMIPMQANELEGSTVLVTGGASFIGSHLVDALIEQDVERVIVFDNLTRGDMKNLAHAALTAPDKLHVVVGDVRNKHGLDIQMEEVDYIYHLAAIRITQCAEDPKEAKETLVDGMFNVITSAIEHNVKKIVYASTASIYGMADEFPTGESHHPYNDKTLYGAFKLCGEGMLRAFHDMVGLDYTVLRFFNVYGPRMDIHGKYTEVIIKWLDRIDAGERPVIFGSADQTLDFVYVADVVNALIMAMKSDTKDAINIGTGKETSLGELAELLVELRGNGSVNLGTICDITKPNNAVSRRKADIAKAKAWLGWSPEWSLPDGLKKLIEWKDRQNED